MMSSLPSIIGAYSQGNGRYRNAPVILHFHRHTVILLNPTLRVVNTITLFICVLFNVLRLQILPLGVDYKTDPTPL